MGLPVKLSKRLNGVVGLSCGLVLAIAVAPARGELPALALNAGMHLIRAEVASNFEDRAKGLMNRRRMDANHGMLFVFPERAQHCMWMRNTEIPLSVAFLDDEGRVLNIADMQPHTEDNHCAVKPARFALEMNAGWFKQRGVLPGQQIGGVAKAPPPR